MVPGSGFKFASDVGNLAFGKRKNQQWMLLHVTMKAASGFKNVLPSPMNTGTFLSYVPQLLTIKQDLTLNTSI